jgi:hypothetical protein
MGAMPEEKGLMAALFPYPPRTFRGLRAWQVGVRTVHVASMGIVLGGVAYGVPAPAMPWPIGLTVASGLGLLGLDLWKSCSVLYQGSGVAVLAKLALIGLGVLFPSAQLGFYLAAAAVSSVGSHMPKAWRHWSFVDRKVI